MTDYPAAPNGGAQDQPAPLQSVCCPYYQSGEQLREKHRGVKMGSGRRFESWALALLSLQPSTTVLDAGCGWGRFTWPLIEEYAVASANITCSDSSLGMLQTAAQEARRRQHCPTYAAADLQLLPFPSNYFDGAMANHVLYHLPDISAGACELARVVKEDGWLLATTNSDDIRVPILEFHYAALDRLGIVYVSEDHSPFSMENGKQILGRWFAEVDQVYFEDETVYNTADEFLAQYKTIGRYRNVLVDKDIDPQAKRQLPVLVRQQAEQVIRAQGALRSPVRMGAFVCRGPIL